MKGRHVLLRSIEDSTMKCRKRIVLLFGLFIPVFVCVATDLNAQVHQPWKPLAQRYPLQSLGDLMIPQAQWKPYPTVANPEGFSAIPRQVRKAYIHKAETLLDAPWPALPASTFLEYKRNGNRSDYEQIFFKRRSQLATLALAEAMEGKGRFLDQIINGIWTICEESFWGVPAHLFLQRKGFGLPDVQEPVVGLFAAETASEMAWVYYLLKPELDKVNPLIAQRIVYEERRRILLPYLQHDNWSYLGFTWKKNPTLRRVNNWNPWINSNILATALLLVSDSALRLKIIHKTMASVDNFVTPYPPDGGSDEGPEYWERAAGSLLDYLELLQHATGGKIDGFDQPVVRNMGQYIYKVYISYPYFFNYGDADAKYKPDPALLYRFGEDTRDTLLVRFAAFEARRQNWGTGILGYRFGILNRAMPALFLLKDLQKVPPEEPLVGNAWMADIQVMAARSGEGSSAGFYVAAKGGDNGVSHNHNDIGNYIVFFNGRPVLVDAGAQTYTAQTFGSGRYQLWNNQSDYHNLPDVNGTMQQAGTAFRAHAVTYAEDGKRASLKMDIAKAYPAQAGIVYWDRTVTLYRGKYVSLHERYQLKDYQEPSVENFLTPLVPDISTAGIVALTDSLTGNRFQINYDKKRFKPVLDIVPVTDGPSGGGTPMTGEEGRMYKIWGPKLYRVRLESKSHKLKDDFTIKIEQA